ncbi:hypothetical protein Bpfe_012212 [Biomphalaria pfeifferi]|uniref:Uncharacterized protein n=1 Tax=Biomphalaria pfeifferi TaxID=112525 RepID=A0AAD8BP52_BIOPF|nr:hypothetical protein Bpfe_012212 [Biomphalaria pfeifferi]
MNSRRTDPKKKKKSDWIQQPFHAGYSYRLCISSNVAKSTVKGKTSIRKCLTNKKEATAFTTFKSNYSELHLDLTRFFQELPERLKTRAPTGLSDVKVIPTIMSPSDEFFNVDEADLVLKKWQEVVDATKFVLLNIASKVAEKNQEWFQEQKKKLDWWIDVVSGQANLLRLETSTVEKLREARAGIGSANRGTADLREKIEMRKKQDTINSLKTLLTAS